MNIKFKNYLKNNCSLKQVFFIRSAVHIQKTPVTSNSQFPKHYLNPEFETKEGLGFRIA